MNVLRERTTNGRQLPSRRWRVGGVCGVLLLALLAALVFRRDRYTVTPTQDTVFTSTRYITSLLAAPDGALWAGTMGGLLRRSPQGVWQKFTRRDGLPAHEVRSLAWTSDGLRVTFPRETALWKNERWQTQKSVAPPAEPPLKAGQTCETVWRNRSCVATLEGLFLRENETWQRFPLPPSSGTHICALLPEGDVLLAALFGDGLWAFNGQDWKQREVGLPNEAREITALARNGDTLWNGTRNAGLWERQGERWKQYLQRDEPINVNCEAIAMFDGRLFVSTLEDGLAVRTPEGWGHCRSGLISSDAPRQMVVFGNRLIARHGNGKLDSFDGRQWQRNIGANLPRKQATALAADSQRLYVGQWGGWSEFDGKLWTHHFDAPELQGASITALFPEGDRLWIGTQTRGVAEFVRSDKTLRIHDEREGLPDDWITVLKRVNGTLYAGTFVGGLARWEEGHWQVIAELAGENITDLAPDDSGGVFVATLHGLRHLSRSGAPIPLKPSARIVDSEAQALCKVPGGLWIGTRTGLYFLAGL